MKVVLIRHLKVIAKNKLFLTAKQFDEGRASYDQAEIEKAKFKIHSSDFPVCYSSSVRRAIETTRQIYDGEFIVTDDLVEVRNAGMFLKMTSLPSFFRSIIGRIAWYFNYSKMPETRDYSMARARRFITELIATTDDDTLLITHGFFMHCLEYVLRQYGFKGKLPVVPKNGHLYVFEMENKIRVR